MRAQSKLYLVLGQGRLGYVMLHNFLENGGSGPKIGVLQNGGDVTLDRHHVTSSSPTCDIMVT